MDAPCGMRGQRRSGGGHARAPGRWALCAALGLAQWPRGVVAWAPAGHERIARIAEGLLKGKLKDQVRTMMHSDLVDFAGWELAMTGKHPETDALHWHRQDPEWSCGTIAEASAKEPANHPHLQPMFSIIGHMGDFGGHVQCDGHGAENGSLFCALAYFFDHFSHDALLKDFPTLKDGPINIPDKLVPLAKLSKLELTSAQYLRWLVVLVGDLHQPLHLLRQHDYGRDVKVSYQGKTYTLLEFFEDYIPRRLPPPPSQTDLENTYKTQSKPWKFYAPPELFRIWAKESAGKVCSDVYQPMEVNHADGTRTLEQPYVVSEDTYQRWQAMANGFTLIAGQRLAWILHDIVEHKRHKHAHLDGRGRHHHKRNWMANLGTNAAVAVVLVPVLVLALRWHGARGGGSLRKIFTGVDTEKAV